MACPNLEIAAARQ